MRNFLMAAIVAIGAAVSAPSIAAPSLAGLDAMTTAATTTVDIEQAQYRDGPRMNRRFVPPGRAYGRRYGGPRPYARSYERRGYGYGRGYRRY